MALDISRSRSRTIFRHAGLSRRLEQDIPNDLPEKVEGTLYTALQQKPNTQEPRKFKGLSVASKTRTLSLGGFRVKCSPRPRSRAQE